ncbi:hypothetical protein BDV36DRAFT_304370 [Aspergillus pseudocaelatus]|uniref:Transcription factor domain-containing protein n=1 Tax=Aspergillus pseudocaelatus TaxID=1825620 RepID=A0ABQ6WX60_9EURO|nr:hypothetical protein BDV36DRAFT_304370 [Aspergillus pseudocaelatus]
MSFDGDIGKHRLLPGDQQLVDNASVQAPPGIRPLFGALGYPNYFPDLGNLFTWGPFDCLDDPQYNAFLNNGAGFNGLDSPCQQIPLPFEPPPVLPTPRSSTPTEPAALQPLPTPAEEIHQSSQIACHVLNDPTASSSTSPRGDPDSHSDDDLLIAENFFHVSAVRTETYEKIQSFYLAQTDICFKKFAFPDANRLNCLVQLYFEYFHSQMPFIHPVMLESDGSWILVLALAVIGSQYTRMAMGKEYIIILSELLRRAIPLDAVKALQFDAMILAQSTLLLNVNLVFNGFRDNIINLQFLRTWLATLIRPFLNPHSKRDSALLDASQTVNIYDRWHAWLQAEAHTRLVYAFFWWLVTNVESIAAGKRIAQMMEKDTERARRCVVHAGAIIREIRGGLAPACYHCFSLLFAFLYLWVYERFHTSTTTKGPRSTQPSPHRLLRIDRDPDPVLKKQWIAGDANCRPYLTGVGLLLEPGASTRLLRECQRILGSYDAWPHLRTGFISALNELVDEVKPLTDAPYSWAS